MPLPCLFCNNLLNNKKEQGPDLLVTENIAYRKVMVSCTNIQPHIKNVNRMFILVILLCYYIFIRP